MPSFDVSVGLENSQSTVTPTTGGQTTTSMTSMPSHPRCLTATLFRNGSRNGDLSLIVPSSTSVSRPPITVSKIWPQLLEESARALASSVHDHSGSGAYRHPIGTYEASQLGRTQRHSGTSSSGYGSNPVYILRPSTARKATPSGSSPTLFDADTSEPLFGIEVGDFLALVDDRKPGLGDGDEVGVHAPALEIEHVAASPVVRTP